MGVGDHEGAVRRELTVRDGKSNDVLGWSVGVSGDTIVAGAYARTVGGKPAQGAAYVFVRPAGGWASTSDPTAELTADDGAAVDDFGYSVAISGDTIVAGAPSHKVGTNLLQGASYVFVKPPGGWTSTNTPSAELTAADGVAADELGQAVGVSGGTVVAGAFTHKVGVNDDQGAVYVFVRPAAGWHGPVASTGELTASDGAAHDTFGISVAVSGDTVVAGAPAHKVGANAYQGAVYVFVRPRAGWSDNALSSELTARDGAAGDLFGGAVAVSGNTGSSQALRHARSATTPTRVACTRSSCPPGDGRARAIRTKELTAGAGVAYDELGSVAGGSRGHRRRRGERAHDRTRQGSWRSGRVHPPGADDLDRVAAKRSELPSGGGRGHHVRVHRSDRRIRPRGLCRHHRQRRPGRHEHSRCAQVHGDRDRQRRRAE